jgi:homoserine dehydrogenase
MTVTPKSPGTITVAILGFGKVGSAVAHLIQTQHQKKLRITHVLNRAVERKRAAWMNNDIIWTERCEDIINSDVDVVIELIGDVEFAHDCLRQALAAGKHVVTANKQLVARYGSELVALAHQNGCRMAYGAAVGGVVPVIPAVLEGLSADTFHRLCGILNGTCNFILSSMESEGTEMTQALEEARQRGFAESDPSADIDGADAAAKLAILIAIAMHRYVTPEQVITTSIRSIEAIDFSYALMLGCTIRQIAYAETANDRVSASVHPALVPMDSPFGSTQGSDNLIAVYGRHSGRLVFSGAGAGGNPTAIAVLSDLLAIQRGNSPAAPLALQPVPAIDELRTRHYLRFIVKDQPGIVAGITTILAAHNINIDAVLQSRGHSDERLPFVITTESSSSETIRAAIQEISRAPYHVASPLNLPVFDSL